MKILSFSLSLWSGFVHHLVLAILSFHSSDRKSPLSSWNKLYGYGKSPEHLWIYRAPEFVSSERVCNESATCVTQEPTYCVLPVFLPIPFHPFFKLFMHGLKQRTETISEHLIRKFKFLKVKIMIKRELWRHFKKERK